MTGHPYILFRREGTRDGKLRGTLYRIAHAVGTPTGDGSQFRTTTPGRFEGVAVDSICNGVGPGLLRLIIQ